MLVINIKLSGVLKVAPFADQNIRLPISHCVSWSPSMPVFEKPWWWWKETCPHPGSSSLFYRLMLWSWHYRSLRAAATRILSRADNYNGKEVSCVKEMSATPQTPAHLICPQESRVSVSITTQTEPSVREKSLWKPRIKDKLEQLVTKPLCMMFWFIKQEDV